MVSPSATSPATSCNAHTASVWPLAGTSFAVPPAVPSSVWPSLSTQNEPVPPQRFAASRPFVSTPSTALQIVDVVVMAWYPPPFFWQVNVMAKLFLAAPPVSCTMMRRRKVMPVAREMPVLSSPSQVWVASSPSLTPKR